MQGRVGFFITLSVRTSGSLYLPAREGGGKQRLVLGVAAVSTLYLVSLGYWDDEAQSR